MQAGQPARWITACNVAYIACLLRRYAVALSEEKVTQRRLLLGSVFEVGKTLSHVGSEQEVSLLSPALPATGDGPMNKSVIASIGL